MLQFKNGKLHTQGCSFLLPEGFYLATELDLEHENGVTLWTPDKSAMIELDIHEEAEDTREGLLALFETDSGLKPLAEIQAVTVNGLRGHEVFYTGTLHDELYYETRLALPDGRVVVFSVQYQDEDIKMLKNTAPVLLVRDSICVRGGNTAGQTD